VPGSEPVRQLALPKLTMMSIAASAPFAANLVVPLPTLRGRQQRRIAAHQLREEPHAVGVIATTRKSSGRESFTG